MGLIGDIKLGRDKKKWNHLLDKSNKLTDK